MTSESPPSETRGLSFFEKYLYVWVVLCIGAGILLGKLAPGVAQWLDGLAIYVGKAPVVSIPIAVCLFFMMYPIMVKIDFGEVLRAGKNVKPIGLTLFVNWAIKPFTMYAISLVFLGVLFRGFIGAEAVDLVKMPFGLDLDVGAQYGVGTVVMHDGAKMLQVPLWRSYLAGCILLGIAPCTAMVLVWGYLARGNDGHTLVMVAINSLTMLVLYGPLGGFLLGVGKLPVPWEALVLSIGIYVALPLVAGFLSRKWIIRKKGLEWFEEKFLHVLTPITIMALLVTLVLLFSFKGDVILSNPLTILWIAVPLFIQANVIFWLGYEQAFGPDISPGGARPEREKFSEVILEGRLRPALNRINPHLPDDAIDEAITKVRHLGAATLAENNRLFHRMVRDGVPEIAEAQGDCRRNGKEWAHE